MPNSVESLCSSCSGACCRDMRFIATPEEAARLAVAGTDIAVFPRIHEIFEEVEAAVGDSPPKSMRMQLLLVAADLCMKDDKPDKESARHFIGIHIELSQVPADKDWYEIKGDCGYLKDGMCTDYENRPGFCQDFPSGSSACHQFRGREGVEAIPVIIQPTPQQTT